MSQPIRSLLLGFSIETTGKEKLDAVDGTVDSILKKVTKLGQGLASLFVVKELAGFITDQIDAGAALSLTAEKLGVTTDELERFRYAANMSGVETQAAERALMMFNRQLGEAELGTKAAGKGIGELGGQYTAAQLSAMPLPELLVHISDKMQGMTDKGQKTQLMMKLFGRQGAALIPMFDAGADGMRKWMEEFDALGGGMGHDFAQAAKETQQGIKRLTFAWDVLRTHIVGAILPGVEKLTLGFTKLVVGLQWLEKHSYMAQTAVIALCAAAAIAFAPFLASILPIVAAMTALYLVFDDFYTMMVGGKSIIGDFIDALFGAGAHETFVADVKKEFQSFITWVKDVAIPGVISFGSGLKSAFVGALPYIREMFEMMKRVGAWIDKAQGFGYGAVKKEDITGPGKGILGNGPIDGSEGSTANKVRKFLQGLGVDTDSAPPGIQFTQRPAVITPGTPGVDFSDGSLSSQEPGAGPLSSSATTPAPVDQSVTNHINVTIPVTTQASKEDIEDAVQSGMSKSLREAMGKRPWAPGMPIPSASPGGQ